MNITNELRKYVKLCLPHYIRTELLSIADSIDAEYQKTVQELNNLSDASILLPIDADKVPICIGDVMVGEKNDGSYGNPFEVVGYVMVKGELKPMDKCKCPRNCEYLHHYHEPTVEDLLQDMVVEWDCAPDGEDKAHVIKYYAEKLLLAANYKKRQ